MLFSAHTFCMTYMIEYRSLKVKLGAILSCVHQMLIIQSDITPIFSAF